MNQAPERDDTFEKVVLTLLFVFIGLLLIFWAGANLASLVASGQVLGASLEEAGHAMFQLPDHLSDPSRHGRPSWRAGCRGRFCTGQPPSWCCPPQC